MTNSNNGNLLNTQKLLNSDFIDRFVGFVEKYDEVRETNNLISVKKWIDNGDYSYIKYFLHLSPMESMVHLSIYELLNLSVDDFNNLQDSCSKLAILLDEQRALYEEFLTFYE